MAYAYGPWKAGKADIWDNINTDNERVVGSCSTTSHNGMRVYVIRDRSGRVVDETNSKARGLASLASHHHDLRSGNSL